MGNIGIIIQSILKPVQPFFDKIGQACSFVSDYISAAFEAFKNSPFYNSDFVQSNAFNFVTVILLLVIICKCAKVGQKLTSAQESVKDSIDNSIKAREDSIEELLKANAATESVKEEISEIEENCDNSITALNEKIEKETDVQIENIHKNTEKIINSENKQIVSELSGKTALAAVELAKKHIKEVLKNKPQYHQKFIEESINELESGLK